MLRDEPPLVGPGLKEEGEAGEAGALSVPPSRPGPVMVRETRHLWVGNLPENTREERIKEHFKR